MIERKWNGSREYNKVYKLYILKNAEKLDYILNLKMPRNKWEKKNENRVQHVK